MARRESLSAKQLVATYNPTLGRHALVEPEEWVVVGPLVRQLAEPFTRLKGGQIRDYLRAATKLCAFAARHDGELSVTGVLEQRVIEGYLRQVPRGAKDDEPYLWRLAREHKVVPAEVPVRHQVGRRARLRPYEDHEVATLLDEARAQSTENRRATLFAIVVLGAGAGLVREYVRDVCAHDVHRHGSDVFVRTTNRCAKVLEGFEDDLDELVALRPKGRLLGSAQAKFITVEAHRWLDGRHGIPHLSVDRLRASYVNRLLRSPASALDVLDWTGLDSSNSLRDYLTGSERTIACPRETQR